MPIEVHCRQWRLCPPAQWGSQHLAIAPAGPMDQLSADYTHACCGNSYPGVVCEWPMYPLDMRFDRNGVVACGGAPRDLWLNDKRLDRYRAYKVTAGDYLRAGYARSGVYGYLAINGGFAAVSDESAGNKIAWGDQINHVDYNNLPAKQPPRYFWPVSGTIRCLPGPEWDDNLKEIILGPWLVTSRRDEAGVQLQGPAIPGSYSCNIVSGPITTGTVQITPSGPLVLLAGRATHGGYARALNVISADIDTLAQIPINHHFRFVLVRIDQARHWGAQRQTALTACW